MIASVVNTTYKRPTKYTDAHTRNSVTCTTEKQPNKNANASASASLTGRRISNHCRQRARASARRASHRHGPGLTAPQDAKHARRRQHSTAHSCTMHHASCNSRCTDCTSSSVFESSRDRESSAMIWTLLILIFIPLGIVTIGCSRLPQCSHRGGGTGNKLETDATEKRYAHDYVKSRT